MNVVVAFVLNAAAVVVVWLTVAVPQFVVVAAAVSVVLAVLEGPPEVAAAVAVVAPSTNYVDLPHLVQFLVSYDQLLLQRHTLRRHSCDSGH